MSDLKFISADSHVQENDALFKERVPAEYRHRLPHMVTIDGGEYEIVEGRKPRRFDLAEANINEDDLNRNFRQDPTGGTDIQRRLVDQERDNIGGEVLYCNSLLTYLGSPDSKFQMAVARAYNDWIMDLFGSHPDRFVPTAILPTLDVAAAVEEVSRLSGMGFRAVSAPIGIKDQPYSYPVYEPLWSALEDAGMVFSLHFNTGTEDKLPKDVGEESYGGFLSYMIISMAEGIEPTALLLSSGVPMRHPDLQFIIVECGGGWLAWTLYALDEQYERKHMWINPKLDMKPSEYFKRQGHVTFGDDPVALTTLGYIGDDALLWGSDYPHDEGTFPHSGEVIDRIFKGYPEEIKRKVVYENAARLYRFPMS
ncbi:MAG: amidohydrolase [Chloroflexi bacterium]|nr:amidohydrolase [Chloroflexota bacterium]